MSDIKIPSEEQKKTWRDRAKRNVKLANEIRDRVESLEIKRPPDIGAHLSDIAIACEEYNELLSKFLSMRIKKRESVGRILIDIRTELNHINYHIRYIKRPLDRLIDFCYEDDDEEHDSE